MREDFYVKFYTVKHSNTLYHHLGLNTLKNDKIMLFQPRQLPFLGIPSVVITGSLIDGSEKSQFICDEMRMQT